MYETYSWLIILDIDHLKLKMPSIHIFGGHEVNTPLYYHDASVRTDRPHMVFQYTLKGEGRFRYKNNEYKIGAGQGFLCNTHDPDIAYFYPPDGDETYELLFCCFGGDIDMVDEIAKTYGPVFNIEKENRAISQFLDYQVRKRYVKSLILPQSQRVQMASLLLTELMKVGEKSESYRITLSQKVEMYLLEHIEEKVSMVELASIFGFSVGHLSRQFKKERGFSLQSFINTTRMKHALKLIQSTTLTVKEVAFRMNFDTPAHFNRSFKRENGFTPGSVRK